MLHVKKAAGPASVDDFIEGVGFCCGREVRDGGDGSEGDVLGGEVEGRGRKWCRDVREVRGR